MTALLRIAQVVRCTEAEGPRRRLALWLQGCPWRCPGCRNPEMLPLAGGQVGAVDDLLSQVRAAADEEGVEGITLLGGELAAQAAGAASLARQVQELGLTVMVFRGYTLAELRTKRESAVGELLAHTNILVDGRYLRDQPETQRRWIGSANQRVDFLSERYQADDPRWLLPNTLEIRLSAGHLTVNGFLARPTLGLWKRPGGS